MDAEHVHDHAVPTNFSKMVKLVNAGHVHWRSLEQINSVPQKSQCSNWLILLSGVSNGYYLICTVAVISSVVAGVYYVRYLFKLN